jgi:hypothetical protein
VIACCRICPTPRPYHLRLRIRHRPARPAAFPRDNLAIRHAVCEPVNRSTSWNNSACIGDSAQRQFGSPTAGVGLECSLLVRRESFRSGSARLGRSQKDGLPSRCRGWHGTYGLKAITRAQREGQRGCCPFHRNRKWTPREHGALCCLLPSRSSAQPRPGLWRTLFSPQSLPHLGRSPFSAPRGQGTDIDRQSPFTPSRQARTR